jgi:teichuronic acid biosynthesis glycosyltransferase TuaC
MLRVLTLATLFPDASRPTFGLFVERQTLGLAALEGVEVEVAAPVGLPPWPLALHPRYRPRASLPRQETWKGLTVHRPRFPVLPGFGESRAGRRLARALLPPLRRLRERFPFEAIDAEFFWPDGVAAMTVSRALGIPFSIKARGSDIHYWGRRPAVAAQMSEAAASAAGLLAVSEALKRDMAALGMPEDKILVHRAGVDLDRFRPLDRAIAKAALGIDGPLLISVGALIPLKGQRLAIETVERIPGATLLIVGDGPDRKALESRARALGDRVRFLGNRPHDGLAALLGAADLLLHASEREGLANVWLEALACGTPVVAADAGGAREAIDRPEAGRVTSRDPVALAAAALELLINPPHPAAVRAAAERFSWQANAEALLDHLARVSAQRK